MGSFDNVEVFNRRLRDSRHWLRSAEHLLAAADTLWRDISPAFSVAPMSREAEHMALTLHGPYYLVAGLSVETFIKALWVKQFYPRAVRVSASKLPGDLKSHRLVDLARKVNIQPLAWRENDLLKRLTVFVKWAGRYPIDTVPNDLAPNTVIGDDHDAVHRFIDRVRAAYDALPPTAVPERTTKNT